MFSLLIGGISSAVARLHSQGYSDQLAWLEAYLKDEARDRSVDGKNLISLVYYAYICAWYLKMSGKRCALWLSVIRYQEL